MRPRSGEVTIRDRILASDLYQSGEPFGPLRMSAEIGSATRHSVRHALENMIVVGLTQKCGHGLYKKPQTHWLHKICWRGTDSNARYLA